MKLLKLILCLLVVACCYVHVDGKNRHAQRSRYLVAGIAFYNLENLFDTINNNGKYDLEFTPDGARQWNTAKYFSKISNMARSIRHMTSAATPMGPAFIGLSEMENISVLEDLVAEIDRQLVEDGKKPWNLKIVHHDSPDRRGVDVAALYNDRLFKFIEVTNTPLHIDGNESFRTRDQMCVTGAIDGDTLSVIVNHWPSRLGGQEQSSYLREAAARLTLHIADYIWSGNPSRGVVVMGDLNDDPYDISCAKVLNARKSARNVAVHGFFNPFWALLDQGIGTLAYDGNWNLFDQIIVSGTLLEQHNKGGLVYRSCRVNNFDFLRTQDGDHRGGPLRTYKGGVYLNGYSDHFPTQIFLVKEISQ